MKKLLLIQLGLVLGLTSYSQVINTFPYTEDFEGETASGSCSGYTMLSTGWSNDATDSGNDWSADNGGTTSSNTGPSVDYNPGTALGMYMYTETSGCDSDTRNLLSPWFDFTGQTGLEMSFAYHMYGADMGTMSVEYRDGMLGTWTEIVAPFTDDQDLWQISTSNITFLGGEDSVQFRFIANTGPSYESDMAIDDFNIVTGSFSGSITDVEHVACFGESTGTLTASTQFGLAPISYSWDNGDTTATATGLAPGIYCVTMVDANMDTITDCALVQDLATSEMNVYTHAVSEWICTDSTGMLVIDSITGGSPSTPSCGLAGLSCTSTLDTLQSNTIGNYNSSTGYPCPLGNWYYGTRHQMTYTASELNAMGVTEGNISGIAFYIDNLQGSDPNLNGWNIKMGCTPDSVMNDWDNVNPIEVFPATDITITTGWNWFQFPSSYYWNGTDNIVIETCLNNSGYTNNAAVAYETTSYTSCIYYRADISTVCGSNNVTGTSTNRPVIRFSNCSATPPYTYNYSWNNGSSMDTTVVSAGTYTFTVEDGVGCIDSNVITINESAPVNVDDTTICETNPSDLVATPGFDTYMWSTSETTSTISITTGGTYYVDAVDSLGCPTSDTAVVSTIPSPVLSASSSDAMLGNDGEIYLSIYGEAYPFTVDWDTDGTGDNDDTENQYNLAAGDYTVVVTDTNGCYSTLTITVNSQVGLEENGFEMAVYPNPTKDMINIQLVNIDDNTIFELVDLQGRTVTAPVSIQSNKAVMDMSELSDGVYFVKVTFNGSTKEVKVIKQ